MNEYNDVIGNVIEIGKKYQQFVLLCILFKIYFIEMKTVGDVIA